MKILFLGAGKMASAIAGGIVKTGLYKPEELMAFDILPAAAKSFTANTGVACATENLPELIQQAEVLLIAVKPQTLQEALAPLNGSLQNKCILSIVAGMTVEKISALAGTERVISLFFPSEFSGIFFPVENIELEGGDKVFLFYCIFSVFAETEITDKSAGKHDKKSDKLGRGESENTVRMIAPQKFQKKTHDPVHGKVSRRDLSRLFHMSEKFEKQEEKQPVPWEVADPKPPVIRSGHMENKKANGY